MAKNKERQEKNPENKEAWASQNQGRNPERPSPGKPEPERRAGESPRGPQTGPQPGPQRGPQHAQPRSPQPSPQRGPQPRNPHSK